MHILKIVSARGRQVAGHNVSQALAKLRRKPQNASERDTRQYVTTKETRCQSREELAREHVKDLESKHKAAKEARALDKDFFLSVLHSSATKRDAKSYIQNFRPSEPAKSRTTQQRKTCGVNLGSLYGPAAVEESPKFVQHPPKAAKLMQELQLHVALVKIRAPQVLSDQTIDGVGRTLAQLRRLGLFSVVVVDCNAENGPPSTADIQGAGWRAREAEQTNRVITAIENNGTRGARLVDNVIGINEQNWWSGQHPSRIYITLRKLLMTPLRRGVIPVIPCIGYTDATQTAQAVPANDIILALTREFAGVPSGISPDEDPAVIQEHTKALRDEVSLDRLINLDPLGGIPATDRPNGYHVFLNMEHEFESAQQDLLGAIQLSPAGFVTSDRQGKTEVLDSGTSNPISTLVETELDTLGAKKEISPSSGHSDTKYWHHIQNLELTRKVLAMLPPTSSALLTTPDEAANSGNDAPFQAARVGTRRQRNPLIHNLLTDKPVFSSSLPVGRLGQQAPIGAEAVSPSASATPTTFAKHGMSVSIFPDPSFGPWRPPIPGEHNLTLTNSSIDLSRLVHLIEDSFGRKLDVQAYLDRVNDRIAGVIIAGQYEGGALLTWETPPGVPDDGSAESRARMVPYLDKFAVLRRSQGSGGVADLIFKAMVRDCFPDGVVWRSRKTNPVNKWYFERSRGTWKLPNTGWTMFWTTPNLSMDQQVFHDSEAVCRAIEPSWADNKSVLD